MPHRPLPALPLQSVPDGYARVQARPCPAVPASPIHTFPPWSEPSLACGSGPFLATPAHALPLLPVLSPPIASGAVQAQPCLPSLSRPAQAAPFLAYSRLPLQSSCCLSETCQTLPLLACLPFPILSPPHHATPANPIHNIPIPASPVHAYSGLIVSAPTTVNNP
jgi:hypothetical protein